jgi:hypothetical protein
MSNLSSLSMHIFYPVNADTIYKNMRRDCEIFGTSFLLEQGKSRCDDPNTFHCYVLHVTYIFPHDLEIV